MVFARIAVRLQRTTAPVLYHTSISITPYSERVNRYWSALIYQHHPILTGREGPAKGPDPGLQIHALHSVPQTELEKGRDVSEALTTTLKGVNRYWSALILSASPRSDRTGATV